MAPPADRPGGTACRGGLIRQRREVPKRLCFKSLPFFLRLAIPKGIADGAGLCACPCLAVTGQVGRGTLSGCADGRGGGSPGLG